MCWHNWSKWQIKSEGDVQAVATNATIGWTFMQQRTCQKCGKVQMDVQRRYGV